MEVRTCNWENQDDGEFTTQCRNEHHFGSLYSPCDLEDDFQTLMFIYCPYCGGKINFVQQSLSGSADASPKSPDGDF